MHASDFKDVGKVRGEVAESMECDTRGAKFAKRISRTTPPQKISSATHAAYRDELPRLIGERRVSEIGGKKRIVSVYGGTKQQRARVPDLDVNFGEKAGAVKKNALIACSRAPTSPKRSKTANILPYFSTRGRSSEGDDCAAM